MDERLSESKALALLLSLMLLLCGCENANHAPISASPLPSPSNTPATVVTPLPSETLYAGNERFVYVFFINVGKADAALVCTKEHSFLIDSGTAESLPQLFGALDLLGVERLDGVFLTHTHKDHIGGFSGLSEYFPVEQAYMPEFSLVKEGKENPITAAARSTGTTLTSIKAENRIEAGEGSYFEALAPIVFNKDDDNDNSLVLRFVYKGTSVLFTGDMQFAEEKTLLDSEADLRADILKVGNHGNPDASGAEFIEKASPQLAVISTDTSVDTDSANERVRELIGTEKVILTQDYDVGVGAALKDEGGFTLFSYERPKPTLKLSVFTDAQSQTANIFNETNETADISGCVLLSERGGEVFRFPQKSFIEPGESCVVGAENSAWEYSFSGDSSPWSKKKEDRALLFDSSGNLLCSSE